MKPNLVDVLRFYGAMKRGVTMKELCVRFKQVAAQPALRILNLEGSKFSRYSDHSLSSSLHSRNSSNPTTPVKGTESLIRTLSKRPSGDKFQPILNVIDARRLVLFGLVHNLIRRVEKFPLLDSTKPEPVRNMMYGFGSPRHNMTFGCGTGSCDELKSHWEKHRKKYSTIYGMLNGNNSYDKICLISEVSQNQLDIIIERDPDVYVILK